MAQFKSQYSRNESLVVSFETPKPHKILSAIRSGIPTSRMALIQLKANYFFSEVEVCY